MMNSPASNSDSFSLLDVRIQRWIWQSGWSTLKDAQEQAIPTILKGKQDVIIAAATASGKTEAAFLPILTRLLNEPETSCVLYISPIKALINDQWQRLDGLCESLDIAVTPWHGDINSSRKRQFFKAPQGCLLITPESLEALLMRNGHALSGIFSGLRYIVVDELHAFIGTERGKQLQSLMHRIDIALNRVTPRIALSATLGDMGKAAEFLRPTARESVNIIVSDDDGQELKVIVRGYIEPYQEKIRQTDVQDIEESSEKLAIAAHLFKTLRGANHLVFPNTRQAVEFYADKLRACCEDMGLPNEFFPHHGNLVKELREETEAALKAKQRPTTAICTTTLELGIDIGAVKSVVQIGCAPSVASLRQRLGRSGRRAGEAAILSCYALENELTAQSSLSDCLREGLVQAIAQIRLLIRGWYEPPNMAGLHLSTLIQQLLSLIAQYGGVTASSAWQILCASGVFAKVSKQDFKALLRELGARDIVMQTEGGLLLHGQLGEKLVNHYSFYAAFTVAEEFRLLCAGKTLGSLPLSQPVAEGSYLIFAGKRWQVQALNMEKKIIEVISAHGGKPPAFTGDGGLWVDDEVRREMRQILLETTPIVFLNPIANALLAEARHEFYRMELDTKSVAISGNTLRLFFWRGDCVMNTIALMLECHGFKAINEQLCIRVQNSEPEKLFTALLELTTYPPEPISLVENVLNKHLAKWDGLLSEDLLAKNYAAHCLDIAGACLAIDDFMSILTIKSLH